MGYYTSYSLSYLPDRGHSEESQKFEEALLEISKDADGNIDTEVKELIETGGVWAKLYDINDWIAQLAPNYPHLLIILSGDGEESDDMWEERWKGHEREFQKAVIPPFQNQNLWTDTEKKHNNQ